MRWYSGAILLLLLGLALQLELLVYAMYVLLGVMLVSRYFARNWIENLSARRECNRLTAEIGDTVAVVVSLQTRGTSRLPGCSSKIPCPAMPSPSGRRESASKTNATRSRSLRRRQCIR